MYVFFYTSHYKCVIAWIVEEITVCCLTSFDRDEAIWGICFT